MNAQPPRPLEGIFIAMGLLAAAGLMNCAATLPAGPVRGVVVLPLALLLPGSSLAAAAPGRVRDPLPALALVPILSVAFYTFSSLALAAVMIELTRTNLLLVVDGLVAVCALVLVRRGSAPGFPVPLPRARSAAALPLIAIAASGFALATVAAARIFPAEREPASTRFALAGRWARVSAAQPLPRRHLAVRLSLENREGQSVRYRIAARIGGLRWPVRAVTLGDGDTWNGSISGAVQSRHCRQRLVVKLARPGIDGPPLSLALEFVRRTDSCGRAGRR